MGLDMFLFRFPRYKNCTAGDVNTIEEWLSYKEHMEKETAPEEKCTFYEWCGKNEDELPDKDAIEFYQGYYGACDDDELFRHVYEEVGYWRKVNAVHYWFVRNVQNGEDDCEYHREVTKNDLINLRDTCKQVIEKVKFVPGEVCVGVTYHPNGTIDRDMRKCGIVSNPEVCEELMPSVSGFFFGPTDYNEYYIKDLEDTVDICDEAINNTDFDKQMIYYCSSW